MTGKIKTFAVISMFFVIIGTANPYKMLGVFYSPLQSHSIVGNSLMKGLADRGHDVTVITPFPLKNAPKNYRHLDLPGVMEAVKDVNTVYQYGQSIVSLLLEFYDLGVRFMNITLAEPSVQKLMASGEKFDVVIVQTSLSDALFGLAEHFNAPLIAVSTCSVSQWATDLVGSPSPPSYVPNVLSEIARQTGLFQRILNLAVASFEQIWFNSFYMTKQRDLFNKYFPKSKLGLDNIRRNTAMVLVNSHFSLGFPRPYVPNMIEVGGMQINRKRKPLPATMQKFLDEAKDGAIYFTMGSAAQSKDLPLEKREVFLQTFRALKQRVLWKFEDTYLPGKSDNVYISDWFPQDDILAHPNVKLFITHGGMLSTTESIYHGKPFVGIPIYADQYQNMALAEAAGYGIKVDFKKISKNTFLTAINEVLQNPQYTEMARLASDRYRDQPMEPLDLASYWVEYVVRHKGAPHLHCAGQDLSFIQYHNLDAIVILYGGILFVLLVLLKTVIKIVLRLHRLLEIRPKVKIN